MARPPLQPRAPQRGGPEDRETSPWREVGGLFGIVAALAAALPAGCGGPPPPSVLLITVDTLRADELGAYGAQPSHTPRLDALAEESTVFEHAAAPMPLTRPSHFSLLTSRYPREHGVLNNRMGLPAGELSVAEVLADRGYRTGAFVGVALLSAKSGAGQGFEVHDSPGVEKHRPANEVVEAALRWIGGLGPREPFFAWVHLFDPHQPYELLDPALGRVDPELYRSLPSIEWPVLYQVAESHGGDIPQRVLDHARSLYSGEVAWVDRWVGRLLEGVAGLRDLDDVVVVLTADHGECFEDGVFFEHSDCMLEGALRIPLLVRHPGSFAPGARVPAQVSSIDVAPTLLAEAGIEAPASFSGRPLQEAAAGVDRYVLIEYPFYQQRAVEGRLAARRVIESVGGVPTTEILVDVEKVGVVGPGWKYMRAGTDEELYRLLPEVDEVRNRAPGEERVRDELRAALDTLLERHPLVVIDSGEINEELRATLQALGYIE